MSSRNAIRKVSTLVWTLSLALVAWPAAAAEELPLVGTSGIDGLEKRFDAAPASQGGGVGIMGGDDEPNDSCAAPSNWGTVTSGSVTGSLSSTDLHDYSKVPVYRTEVIDVQMLPSLTTSDFDLGLYAPNCTLITESRNGANVQDRIVRDATTDGEHRFRVYYFSGPYGQYNLGFSIAAKDAGVNGDAGNTASGSRGIGIGTYSGALTARGSNDVDWYHVSVSAGQTLTFRMTPDCSDDFDLQLYKADGTTLIGSSTATGCNADQVSCTATLATTVKARIYIWSGAGGYTVQTSTGGSSANVC